MNCPNDQVLSAFCDGELPPAEMAQVRTHLQGCAVCSDVVRAIESASTMLRTAEWSNVSQEMLDRWSTAKRAVQDRSLRRFVGSLTGIAASVLIVASFARQQTSDASSPTFGEWEQIALAGEDEGDSSHVAATFMAADLSMRRADASSREGNRP